MVFNGGSINIIYIYLVIDIGIYGYRSKLGTLTTRRIVKRSLTGGHESPQFVR